MPVHKSQDKPISPAQQKANETKARKKAELEKNFVAGGEKVAQSASPNYPENAGASADSGRERNSPSENSPPAAPVDGRTQVIMGLVQQGYSYDQAAAMVNGTGAPAPAAQPDRPFNPKAIDARTKKLIEGDDSDLPPVEDVEERELPTVTMDFEVRAGLENYLFELEKRLIELRDDPEDKIYILPIPFSKKLYDFLLADTLREGVMRRDGTFTEARMVEIIFKQRLALDPTKGGTSRASKTGPRGSYNAQSGGWD